MSFVDGYCMGCHCLLETVARLEFRKLEIDDIRLNMDDIVEVAKCHGLVYQENKMDYIFNSDKII